jgi:dUTPase
MKRTVKVLLYSKHAQIAIKDNGDCFDLFTCEDAIVKAGTPTLISLGLAMRLPTGCVAKIYDRSSTPRKVGVHLAHSVGYIDWSYQGRNDIWRYSAKVCKGGTKQVRVPAGTRICQFEICLSQRATVWQKLKWLFTSGYKFEYVDDLEEVSRGGFGTTENNPKNLVKDEQETK